MVVRSNVESLAQAFADRSRRSVVAKTQELVRFSPRSVRR